MEPASPWGQACGKERWGILRHLTGRGGAQLSWFLRKAGCQEGVGEEGPVPGSLCSGSEGVGKANPGHPLAL